MFEDGTSQPRANSYHKTCASLGAGQNKGIDSIKSWRQIQSTPALLLVIQSACRA